MLLPTTPQFRKRRGRPLRRPPQATPPVPPGPLTLVSAVYDPGATVMLTFDRAIDIAALSAPALHIDDGLITGELWEGVPSSAFLTGPATVRVELQSYDTSGSAHTFLHAGPDTGILAVGDGAAWAGVEDVELPFP